MGEEDLKRFRGWVDVMKVVLDLRLLLLVDGGAEGVEREVEVEAEGERLSCSSSLSGSGDASEQVQIQVQASAPIEDSFVFAFAFFLTVLVYQLEYVFVASWSTFQWERHKRRHG
jgi:hypothetical protein